MTDQSYSVRGVLEKRWNELSLAANAETADSEEDIFNIGLRDGFSEAVQMLDRLTGGDGEYRFCVIGNERHCPTPVELAERIVAACAVKGSKASD